MKQAKEYGIYCYWGSTDRFTVYYTDTIEKAFALIVKKYKKNMNLGGARITNGSRMLMNVDAQKLVENGDDYCAKMIQYCHEEDEEVENA